MLKSSTAANMALRARHGNDGKRNSLFLERYERIIENGITDAAFRGYNVAYIEINKVDYDCMGGQEIEDVKQLLISSGYKICFQPSTPVTVVLEIAFWE